MTYVGTLRSTSASCSTNGGMSSRNTPTSTATSTSSATSAPMVRFTPWSSRKFVSGLHTKPITTPARRSSTAGQMKPMAHTQMPNTTATPMNAHARMPRLLKTPRASLRPVPVSFSSKTSSCNASSMHGAR